MDPRKVIDEINLFYLIQDHFSLYLIHTFS